MEPTRKCNRCGKRLFYSVAHKQNFVCECGGRLEKESFSAPAAPAKRNIVNALWQGINRKIRENKEKREKEGKKK